MTERRYDDDEVQRIFEEASRIPRLPASGERPAGTGFSLAELKEIGAEAGLDPARVVAAARSLDHGPGTAVGPVRRLVGLPIGVSRSVDLPADFDDDDWNRLVVDLRQTFDARGKINVNGPFREWTNGNLQALVEPTDDGYQLRLKTFKESAQGVLAFSLGGLVFSVFLTLVLLNKGDLDVKWVVPAFFALMSVGGAVSQMIQLPGWAETRQGQMEEVANRALLRAAEKESEVGEE